MAAVLCLAVLGAGYFTMQTGVKSDSCETADAPKNTATASQKCADTGEPEAAMEEAAENDYKGVVTDGTENGAISGASGMDIEGEMLDSAKPEADVQQPMVRTEDLAEEKYAQEDCGAEMPEMTLEEVRALPVIGEYVPENWPDEGVFVRISGSREEGAECAALLWTYDNMQDGFLVKVENMGGELPEWVNEEIDGGSVIQGEDLSKEYVLFRVQVPTGDYEAIGMPEGEFGVLYKMDLDYVLVTFKGRGAVEDVWNLMQR